MANLFTNKIFWNNSKETWATHLRVILGVRIETSVINDGDKRKKAKENNLDLSLNQDDTDVFSEDIDSSRCASIL